MAKRKEPPGGKAGMEPGYARVGGAAGRLEVRAEELRSSNEELRRINAGLRAELDAMFAANTDLQASEARSRLLLRELSHRVKNTLAVIQSIARQSFRGGVSADAGFEKFSARLRAFAEAHNLLVNSDWRDAGFRELAERQLGPYARAGGKKIALEGPAVSMPPDIATPFALVLHELATNALKYGALSAPGGTVRLEWDFVQEGADRVFRFIWREANGPKAEPPLREGFGNWLIQNGLPDAQVTLEFPQDGAVCTITMPAGNLDPV
jgi:two-component system, chemotaxis family, CheB/CheR fusion protein